MTASKDGTGKGKQRPDFFVSYTGADVAWAEWIAWQLEAAGYRILIQAWDFGAGLDFVTEMRQATARAERTLAVLSPAYVASGFAIAEWNAAFAADPTGEGRKLVPVRVVDFVPVGLDSTRSYIDLVGLSDAAARQRLLSAVRSGRTKPTTAPPFPPTPPGPPLPSRLPEIWNVPARNPNFVGREEQLDELRAEVGKRAASVAVVAVSGLGGVGKTQLIVEHAWRRAADYDVVWWVTAEPPAAVLGALAPLAGKFGVPTDDPELLVELLHAELARRERWLMVFDNAEDPASIEPYLPARGAGDILVTSRNPAWRSRGIALDLDVWAREEAVEFLLARTGRDDPNSAESLADELGLLPLALEQAGAYVDETGMALGAFRNLLISRRGQVLDRGTPAFYRATVATTFGLAYDRAIKLSPPAAEMLGMCSFLAPDDIPTELVATANSLADEDALATLRRLALVRRQGDSLAVHRLVGDVVRERLGRDEATSSVVAAITRRSPPELASLGPAVAARLGRGSPCTGSSRTVRTLELGGSLPLVPWPAASRPGDLGTGAGNVAKRVRLRPP
jgi:hypothetical protein